MHGICLPAESRSRPRPRPRPISYRWVPRRRLLPSRCPREPTRVGRYRCRWLWAVAASRPGAHHHGFRAGRHVVVAHAAVGAGQTAMIHFGAGSPAELPGGRSGRCADCDGWFVCRTSGRRMTRVVRPAWPARCASGRGGCRPVSGSGPVRGTQRAPAVRTVPTSPPDLIDRSAIAVERHDR